MRFNLLCCAFLVAFVSLVNAADLAAERAAAHEAMKKGNWKDAYAKLSKLAFDPENDPKAVGDDLNRSIQCLNNLGRADEMDDFREKVIGVHKDNWRLLKQVAHSYGYGTYWGYMVAGKFHRGHHRGGGEYCTTFSRDRVRALQLMTQAMEKIKTEPDKNEASDFYLQFASMLLSAGQNQPWRLQILTDIKELPDIEVGYGGGWGGHRGAPVDADGNPVYHKLPKSYETAASDGERWRWCMMQAAELAPANEPSVRLQFANFLQNQFDVSTLSNFGHFFNRGDEDANDAQKNMFSLSTLGEDETIGRLASGVKRFKLPDEFNYIKIYKDVAAAQKNGWGEQALSSLTQIFLNRQQYPRAAEIIQQNIQQYGDHNNKSKTQQLNQIVGNWGQFEATPEQPAGRNAELSYRFRNAKNVSFTAHEVNVKKLLEDVKGYLKTKPGRLDWQHVNLSNIGWRLVQQNQAQYQGAQVAEWKLELKPREKHFDRRIEVETPLKKGGAYLVTATLDNGNTSRIVVWVADTLIVQRNTDKSMFYYIADALTGQPVPNAELEFFGYKQEWLPNNQTKVDFAEFTAAGDKDGQYFADTTKLSNDKQWTVIARQGERFAFHGFTHVWYNQYYDNEYNMTKVFGITDRPVYRPEQTMKFKFWVAHTKYDQVGPSRFAGQTFPVEIRNPKGEKIFEKSYTADEFGGLEGDFALSKDATLGAYHIHLPNIGGGIAFRIEEYKKPEFEVKVDAPSEPVMLGEKIAAKVKAKYYFGAPVTDGKIKYKVMRSSHTATWFPSGTWDWFYQPGYWWFGADYHWYPGFREWGCKRPTPMWWGRNWQQPELVTENEVPVGHDGTISIDIDTAVAKAMQGDTDHKYEITAEVTDQSRRTIVGSGSVLVARKPFKVYAWVDRGHYKTGDAIEASFNAQTLDHKPVKGKGKLRLLKLAYKDGAPVENEVQKWDLDTNDQGRSTVQMKADQPGQYRVSYTVKDAKDHEIEGGYVFCIRGEKFDGRDFRFNDIELVTDKREYAPGEKVNLLVNTDNPDATVLLFERPANGMYLAPKVVRMGGKSMLHQLEVQKRDMPNFFFEALTVSNGKVFTETREIIVPPESRVLNVDIKPSKSEYKPGENAKVEVQLTELNGEPFVGSTVVTVYDKSVEYISGGSNVPDIRKHFWQWRRGHHPSHYVSSRHESPLLKKDELGMQYLGVFGFMAAEEDAQNANGLSDGKPQAQSRSRGEAKKGFGGGEGGGGELRKNRQMDARAAATAAPGAPAAEKAANDKADRLAADLDDAAEELEDGGWGTGGGAQPTVRKNFADTAFWAGTLKTNNTGKAVIDLPMPENLTTWKIKVWGMGANTRVGQGETEVITTKSLLVRLQAPRFFTQKDEVVLSANIHNYLKSSKPVKVALELDGPALVPQDARGLQRVVEIDSKGEKRIDWRVNVVGTGTAMIRVKAITDEESDAMQMSFPAQIHGMQKMDSFAGNIRPDKDTASVRFTVPAERRVEDTRLEVRYSPTLAGAMIDALPYLSSYPYGCTEQTLSRFLPTVITQRVLARMNINLKEVRDKITNLNAQEIGDDKERAKQWQRANIPAVFDEEEVRKMAEAGVTRLTNMQCADGGWGWFSGHGEYSTPHTTAHVVHGFQIAQQNDVKINPDVLQRGIHWLQNHQNAELQKIRNALTKTKPYKEKADNMDAFVYMVLADAGVANKDMGEQVFKDRVDMAVYSKAMLGLAFQKQGQADKVKEVLTNIEQFLVQDEENQTAYLKLPENNHWWYWYGSEYEAQAYYLKLLAATNPKGEVASRMVKYLINNRKHSSYWNSTRDTAICVEAISDYLRASGEDGPDMTLEVLVNGRKTKEVAINGSNLFSFDNKLVLTGKDIPSGKNTVEFRKKGKGPLYFNAYVSNFTMEDHITKAGLEVKVDRKYYRLKKADKEIKVEGVGGRAVNQKVEKYVREELKNLDTVKSGDLLEIELEIDSKNDYEYICFEDMKAAGCEPFDVRSGYNGNAMGAYMELRDERVVFFVRQLARGKHSIAYKMRAEIPGKFSALPTKAYGMYAPELKGNSDEIKINITD